MLSVTAKASTASALGGLVLLLAIAWAKPVLPPGIPTLLRLAILVACVGAAIAFENSRRPRLAWCLGAIAFLANPMLRRFLDHGLWLGIEAAMALALVGVLVLDGLGGYPRPATPGKTN